MKKLMDNLENLQYGQRITFRGYEYWMVNGFVYRISLQSMLGGNISGYEYAQLKNGKLVKC